MEKYKKLSTEITDSLNSYGFDQKAFNTAMSNEHRTLQQNFTRVCLGWLEHVASDEYRTDGRNEASKEIAKELINSFRENARTKGYTDSTLELMAKPSGYLPLI